MRKLHLIAGLLGLVAFILTGQYLHWAHNHLQGMADGPRLIFRSSHIYLLWAALLNLGLGAYLHELPSLRGKVLQRAGSLALWIAPGLLCWSFFFERYSQELSRPVGRMGIYLALAGTLLHVAASLLGNQKD